jgi:transcriptional regulator with XRE-family HTH domain
MTLERLGEKIRKLRTLRGLSQIRLGQALGYADGSYLSEVENGKKNPTAEFIFKVSQFFGVSADDLLNDERDI